MMVESREDGEVEIAAPHSEASAAEIRDDDRRRQDDGGRVLSDPADEEESLPQSPMTMQDGIRAVQHAFAQASPPPRWPMYVRQAKQFLKARIEGFDERKYGVASVVDVLRAAAKDGVLKLERDRHGAFRVFAGPKLTAAPQPRIEVDEPPIDVAGEVIAEQPPVEEGESIEEAPIVDAEPIETPAPIAVAAAEAEAVVDDGNAEVAEPPKKGGRKRKAAPRTRAGRSEARKSDKTARPHARKSTRTKSEAADR